MRAVFESAFDILYLITVITIGIVMIAKSGGRKQYRLFGIMAVVLGSGDAFHLIPRVIAFCSAGDYTAMLGIGKLVTSITMTVFYVLLFHIFVLRYGETKKPLLTAAVYLSAAVRIALCLFPQNAWTSAEPPVSWGIFRNIPFLLLGILIIVLFARRAGREGSFRWMWLAITLSFAFYLPVVLWAGAYPMVGMLMIPKTCAYVWMVAMGLHAMKKNE